MWSCLWSSKTQDRKCLVVLPKFQNKMFKCRSLEDFFNRHFSIRKLCMELCALLVAMLFLFSKVLQAPETRETPTFRREDFVQFSPFISFIFIIAPFSLLTCCERACTTKSYNTRYPVLYRSSHNKIVVQDLKPFIPFAWSIRSTSLVSRSMRLPHPPKNNKNTKNIS